MKGSAAYAITMMSMLLSAFITSSAQRVSIIDQFKLLDKAVKSIPLPKEANFCKERVTSRLLNQCDSAIFSSKNNRPGTSLVNDETSKRCCSGDLFESRKKCMCLVQENLAQSDDNEVADKKRVLKALDSITANFASRCGDTSLLKPDCSAEAKKIFEFKTLAGISDATCDKTAAAITKPCSSATVENRDDFCCKALSKLNDADCFCAGVAGFEKVTSTDKTVSDFLNTVVDPKSEISRQCGFVAKQHDDCLLKPIPGSASEVTESQGSLP